MRTIESAKKHCYAAWAAQPNATHGWCIQHEIEFEPLTEPIANRIEFILSSKSRGEQVCRLDNMRPVSPASLAVVLPAWKAHEEATATARKAYEEAKATAWKAYEEAKAPAWKAYEEATAPAWKAYVEAKATAWKAYEEATATALKAYEEATATAWKAYEEATATAHRQDVPNHTWNGKSIFKK